MKATVYKHTSLATWRPRNFLTAPFFVRRAWVGWVLFLLSALGFALLSWQVKTNPAVQASDMAFLRPLHEWARQQPKWIEMPLRFFSAWGRDGIALTSLILLVGWMIKRAEREISLLIMGFFGTELWFQFFSGLFARERPDFKDPFETLIGNGYPSGHAATNLVFVILVWMLLLPNIRAGWKKAVVVAAGLIYVAVVCFSRLFLGLHYPTDILGGLLLGLAWGALVFVLYERYWWRRRSGVTAPRWKSQGREPQAAETAEWRGES